MRRRLAYFGTPGMAVPPLQALVAAGHDVALVVTRADKRRGRGSELSPSPVKAAALELGLPVSHAVDDVLGRGRRARRRGRVRSAHQAARAGRGADGEPALLAAAPLAWRGAGRAGAARRRRRDRCVPDAARGGPRHRPGLRHRARAHRRHGHRRRAARASWCGVGTEQLVRVPRRAARRRPCRRRASRRTRPRSDPTSCASTGRSPPAEIDRLVRLGGAWTTFRGKRVRCSPPSSANADAERSSPTTPGLRLRHRAARGQGADAASPTSSAAPARSPASRSNDANPPARVAFRCLQRIDHEGAYANLVARGRAAAQQAHRPRPPFVTELVYGTTRMRRACDALVDRFVSTDAVARGAHRAAPRRLPAALRRRARARRRRRDRRAGAEARRGLRQRRAAPRVAARRCTWPSDAVRLSYPDWIVERLIAELGHDDALATLDDDERSAVGHRARRRLHPGPRLAVGRRPRCPPRRPTRARRVRRSGRQGHGHRRHGRARGGGRPAAAASRPHRRERCVASAPPTCSASSPTARRRRSPPARSSTCSIDAPCSGLGTLRRRADARWRITAHRRRRPGRAAAAHHRRRARRWSQPAARSSTACAPCSRAESIDHTMPAGFEPIDRPAGRASGGRSATAGACCPTTPTPTA